MALSSSMLKMLFREEGDDARGDATYEALSKWCIHIRDYAVSIKHQSMHESEMMAACCMHTGYWPELLSKRLFDTGDAAFRARWQEFVEDSDEPVADMTSKGDVLQNVCTTADVADATGHTSHNLNKWCRAATPVELAIGMVQ